MLYPQNGDRIVTTDSVMSLHTMYKIILRRHSFNCIASLSLHKEWKDLDNNADMRVNTNYNHAISDKKLVNFGPVTQEFTTKVCASAMKPKARRVDTWLFCESAPF